MALAKSIAAFVVAFSLAAAEFLDVSFPEDFNEQKPAYHLTVFARKDAPYAFQNATVTFSRFAFQPAQTYDGIELNLIRYQDSTTQNLRYSCCGPEPLEEEPPCKTPYTAVWWVNENDSIRIWEVVKHKVSKNAAATSQTISESGVYVVMLTDCGPGGLNASITGLIELKNPFGYLPGDEYYKLPLYGVLVLTYVFLTCCWIIPCIRHYQDLLRLQTCILTVLLMSLVEVSVWYLHYKRWNDKGRQQLGLLHVAVFASVLRESFLYMLALVCVVGWGVTRPSLGRSVFLHIACFFFIYIPNALAWRLAAAELPPLLLLLISIVIIFYWVFILCWVFKALNNSIRDLTAQKQTEKAKLFHKLRYLLIAGLFVMIGGVVGQIWIATFNSRVQWRYIWVWEGINQFEFLFVLFCLMVLWRPHKESHRYAYTFQLQSEDSEDDEPAVAPVTDALDKDDEDDFEIEPGDGNEKLGLEPVPMKMGASDALCCH